MFGRRILKSDSRTHQDLKRLKWVPLVGTENQKGSGSFYETTTKTVGLHL